MTCIHLKDPLHLFVWSGTLNQIKSFCPLLLLFTKGPSPSHGICPVPGAGTAPGASRLICFLAGAVGWTFSAAQVASPHCTQPSRRPWILLLHFWCGNYLWKKKKKHHMCESMPLLFGPNFYFLQMKISTKYRSNEKMEMLEMHPP